MELGTQAPAFDAAIPEAQQDPSTPVNAGTGQAADSAVAPAEAGAPDPRAEINGLATEFGVDLSGFNDVASARAALRLLTDQSIAAGLTEIQQMQGPYVQPPYDPRTQFPPQQLPISGNVPGLPNQAPYGPVAADPAAYKPIDLKAIGLDEGDPAAKAIRAVEAQLGQSLQATQAVAAQVAAFQQQAQDRARAERNAQADSIIDGWKSPQFGVAGYRTWAQQAAVDELLRRANGVMVGDVRNGRRMPTIPQMLARARMSFESPAAPQQTQNGQTVNAPALRQASPTPAPAQPLGLHQSWSSDPKMRAAHGISDY